MGDSLGGNLIYSLPAIVGSSSVWKLSLPLHNHKRPVLESHWVTCVKSAAATPATES